MHFDANKWRENMNDQSLFIGFTSLDYKMVIMYIIGILLIYLAIKKDYEPMLLLPIGFGAILVNLPLSVVNVADADTNAPGVLKILYNAGIATELFPVLIFIAIGAMCDFTPLFKNPVMIFFGAAAQFGIFATMLIALLLGNSGISFFEGFKDLKVAASVGIIGAADGPTSIYVANKFAKDFVGPITVAAYS